MVKTLNGGMKAVHLCNDMYSEKSNEMENINLEERALIVVKWKEK